MIVWWINQSPDPYTPISFSKKINGNIIYENSFFSYTDTYFLHNGNNLTFPANTVIHYSSIERLFRYPGGNTTCKGLVDTNSTKVRLEVPLKSGEYRARSYDIYRRDFRIFGIVNFPIKLRGVLRVNNTVFNDPVELQQYDDKFYINGESIGSTEVNQYLEIAADESSLPNSLGLAEALQEAYVADFSSESIQRSFSLIESQMKILKVKIASGVVLTVATACFIAWRIARRRYSTLEDLLSSGRVSED